MSGQQAPAGWYPVGDGTERYWDGSQWTDQIRDGAGGSASMVRSAASSALGNFQQTTQLPEGTIWHAVGRPLKGFGAGKYRLDEHYLYFEKGTLRTDSQQVPIANVLDVDVSQSLSQKARDVFTVSVHIQRTTGMEIVNMEDIPNGREAQRVINENAHAARLRLQQQQNTLRYEGTPPSHVPGATSQPAQTSSAPAGGGSDDLIQQLQKLADLKAAGMLSDDEFAAAKARLIGS